MDNKNIMIVGVGGQGTLLTSRILGKLATISGFDVKLSEVHGIVEEGQADVLIAFERLEALRYLHFLKKDGVVIVNDWRIDPITVVTRVASYPENIIDTLKASRKTIVVEATKEAKKMGMPKAFNVIVLGAAARHMGFAKESWIHVIETTVPEKTVEVNKKAFEIGYGLSV